MRKLLPLLVMLILLLVPGLAFAEDWPAKNNVPFDKTWTIKFSQEVDPTSVDNHSVYVTDNVGRLFIYTEPSLGEDKKSITVKTTLLPYHSYANYLLHLSTAIKSIIGNALDAPVDMNFTTGPREGTNTYSGIVSFEEDLKKPNVSKTLTITLQSGTIRTFDIGYFTTVDGNFDDKSLNDSFVGKTIYFAVDQVNPNYMEAANYIQAIFTNKP